MTTLLEEIVAKKELEVAHLKKDRKAQAERKRTSPIRDFKRAISAPGRVNLIAEIKFASPSAGMIREKSDPITIGKMYEEGGASAVSLLTDRSFFGGDVENLPRLSNAVSLPVLRKDFIIHEIQLIESFLCGADAILLIARILGNTELKNFLDLSRELELASLTEVHTEEELLRALSCGAEIIGINNRNLDTFEVDLTTTARLTPLVPEGRPVVSESGLRDEKDMGFLRDLGVHAALIGSALMRVEDIAEGTRKIVMAGIEGAH
jgi:indole-3-glycerol phosphate synthase